MAHSTLSRVRCLVQPWVSLRQHHKERSRTIREAFQQVPPCLPSLPLVSSGSRKSDSILSIHKNQVQGVQKALHPREVVCKMDAGSGRDQEAAVDTTANECDTGVATPQHVDTVDHKFEEVSESNELKASAFQGVSLAKGHKEGILKQLVQSAPNKGLNVE